MFVQLIKKHYLASLIAIRFPNSTVYGIWVDNQHLHLQIKNFKNQTKAKAGKQPPLTTTTAD